MVPQISCESRRITNVSYAKKDIFQHTRLPDHIQELCISINIW